MLRDGVGTLEDVGKGVSAAMGATRRGIGEEEEEASPTAADGDEMGRHEARVCTIPI